MHSLHSRKLGFALICVLTSAFALSSASKTSLPEDSLPEGLRSPLTKPTLPAPLERHIESWEPQRALVVALTSSFLANQPKALETYLELFRIAAPYLDILIMVPIEQPDVQVKMVQSLSQNPADKALLKRIKFVAATNATVWARDYLPEYALGIKGRLVILDSGRTDFTGDPTEALNMFTDPDTNPSANYYRQLQRTLSDDVTPAYLASYLRTAYRYELQLVRPPISLDGGDFISVGDGEVILSESTLRYNGGEEEDVQQVMKEYFGINKVHFLPTLPGVTIDHLDFIMMPANASTLLVAEPPPAMESPQFYDSILTDQVTEVLTENRRYLEEHFPKKTIIPVPMPPIMRTPRSEVLMNIRQKVVRELCNNYLVAWNDISGRANGGQNQSEAQRRFESKLLAQFGQVNFANDQDLDRVAQSTLGESLAQLEADYTKDTVPYRTYLNATYLHNAAGQQVVIIPRYKPRSQAEVEILEQMETQVLAAYHQAFPEAKLAWLDCDSIIGSFGAVHCITHTVPDWEAIRKKP